MFKAKKVYIIDFDNTVLDIERLKNDITSKFPSKSTFTKLYNRAKINSGNFNPQELPEKYRDYFIKTNFRKYLFPKASLSIETLKKTGRVIIFSFGDNDYQSLKIQKSGIENIVGKENIFIVQNKKEGVIKLIKNLKSQKYSEIFVVDDVSEVLETAFEKYPQIINIWLRYGKYKNRFPVMRNSVIAEVDSFELAVDFIKRFIGLVSPKKSHIKYPILKDIDNNQVSDLINYTGRDKKVSVCTHDDGRFKNKKTFESWKKRGKFIYTLSGRTGKLLGIIWFAKKKYKNFKDFSYTLGVRVYPPIRGKGLSYKFLKSVSDDFQVNHNNSGYWLLMQKGNMPAEHLYKKFGFKPQEEKGHEILMIKSCAK